VSTSRSRWREAALALVGIAQLADDGVVDGDPRGGDDEAGADLDEPFARDRLDPHGCTVDGDLDLTRRDSHPFAERLWNYHTSSLVDGSTDTITIPSSCHEKVSDSKSDTGHAERVGHQMPSLD
jgi:hypothetical protein